MINAKVARALKHAYDPIQSKKDRILKTIQEEATNGKSIAKIKEEDWDAELYGFFEELGFVLSQTAYLGPYGPRKYIKLKW